MSRSGNVWLDAREPMDARSRSRKLAEQFTAALHDDATVLDLGCGSGSNVRYLQPLCSKKHDWIGFDCDSAMLEYAAGAIYTESVAEDSLKTQRIDLASELSKLPHGRQVAVTASAFLDITSREWCNSFAEQYATSPILIAMTTTGQPDWNPQSSADEAINGLLREHQHGDHGFGSAVGNKAAQELARQLTTLGCRVVIEPSDWILDSDDASMLRFMIMGVAHRVRAMEPGFSIDAWEAMRSDQIERGELRIRLPHEDLLSLPR